MPGKKQVVVLLVLLLLLQLLTVLAVPETAFALGGPAPTSIFLMFEPVDQPFANGCSADYIVRVISQIGFQGKVNLTVINPPAGVSAALKPDKVIVPEYYETVSVLTVKIMPDTPQGKLNLTVRGVSADGKASDTQNLTITVASPCEQPKSEVKTTTVTTTTTIVSTHPEIPPPTTTVSTTLTKTITNTSTEQVTEPSTYAWAISATVATIVLATVVVMFLRRAK